MNLIALLKFLLALCCLPFSLVVYILAYLVGTIIRFSTKGFQSGLHQDD